MSDTYEDRIGFLQRAEVDMIKGMIIMDSKLFEYQDFLIPIVDGWLRIYFRASSSQIGWHIFFTPLSSTIWFWYMFTCFILPLVIWLLRLKKLNTTQKWLTPMNIFRCFCNQVCECAPTEIWERCIYLVLHMTTFVIWAAYCGALLSLITIQTYEPPFKSMDDLISDGSYKIIMGSNYRINDDPMLGKLANYSYGSSETETYLRDLCHEDKYAVIAVDLPFLSKFECKLSVLQTGVNVFYSYSVVDDTPFIDALNQLVLAQRETGLLERNLKINKDLVEYVLPFHGIQFETVASIFITFIVCVGIAVMVLLLEICWFVYKTNLIA